LSNIRLIIINVLVLSALTYIGIGAPSFWKKMFTNKGDINWFWVAINLVLICLVFILIITTISIYIKQHPEKTQSTQAVTTNKVTDKYFNARLGACMIFKYIGPLLYFYDSKLGKTIAPVNIAIYLEVSNLKPLLSRIYTYKAKAFIEYMTKGKTFKKWYDLHSLPLFNNEVYWVNNNDLTKCTRIDFSENSFDILARNKQLQQGESISGWMFFEIDRKVRGLDYKPHQIELTLESPIRESQTILLLVHKTQGDEYSILSSGTWKTLPGHYDLTKEKYTIYPFIDLLEMFKR